MKCRLYLQNAGAGTIDLGSFTFADDRAAREAARQCLNEAPLEASIDVWAECGELYRVERQPHGAAVGEVAAHAVADARP